VSRADVFAVEGEVWGEVDHVDHGGMLGTENENE